MRRHLLIATASALGIAYAGTRTLASWDPGDPYKMHYPQLPDPNGWDVKVFLNNRIADDWLCMETGPVTDIHMWASWRGDDTASLLGLIVRIYDNVPDPDGNGPLFSHPGNVLWLSTTDSGGVFTERLYGSGDLGWYNPYLGTAIEHDHTQIYQYSWEDIPDPFIQQGGSTYWLEVSTPVPPGKEWGWTTSLDHFDDGAVWRQLYSDPWEELWDPLTQESLALAFVITPEPATLSLLALGGLFATRRRR